MKQREQSKEARYRGRTKEAEQVAEHLGIEHRGQATEGRIQGKGDRKQ